MLKSFQAEVERKTMLKVVVFDSGYGGELFADYLQENLPVIQIVRVIDWRNANMINTRYREGRKIAEAAIKPYIGKVDLIIFANHLLTITSLKYFKRRYRNQNFLGFSLRQPKKFNRQDTLILTTRAVAKTINYYNFILHLKQRTKTLTLDSWLTKIDDGELTREEIIDVLKVFSIRENILPRDVILACSHFNDIKTELRTCFGGNIRIHDSFEDAFCKTCKILKLRGGTGRKL